jgi:hypothetical protein
VSCFDWPKIILDEAIQAKLIHKVSLVEPVLNALFNSTMHRPDYIFIATKKLSQQLGCPLGL